MDLQLRGRAEENLPVVILSRNEPCEVRKNVTVAIVTHTIRNIPTEIAIGSEEGLAGSGVINVGDIYATPKDYLMRKNRQPFRK